MRAVVVRLIRLALASGDHGLLVGWAEKVGAERLQADAGDADLRRVRIGLARIRERSVDAVAAPFVAEAEVDDVPLLHLDLVRDAERETPRPDADPMNIAADDMDGRRRTVAGKIGRLAAVERRADRHGAELGRPGISAAQRDGNRKKSRTSGEEESAYRHGGHSGSSALPPPLFWSFSSDPPYSRQALPAWLRSVDESPKL